MWWTKPARQALLSFTACAALCACSTGKVGQVGPHGALPPVANAPTPLEQYAVTVDARPEQVALNPHAYGLSDAQRQALAAFVETWKESGDAVITVKTPSSTSTCGCDPHATAHAASAMLSTLGVPPSLLRTADYDGGAPGAPVIAVYDRYAASAENCMGHWSNLVSTNDNSVSSHFGCAVTHNFAAQVADPRDFLRPAPTEAADNSRRAVVLEKYRKGQITSSAKDDQAAGTVSQAVH